MCREHAAEFRPQEQAFRDAGIQLAFISGSKGRFAAGFVEATGLTSPVLVDPDLHSYRLLGFLHAKFPVLIDPRGAPAAARALSKGILQGPTAGDPQQQGGVVVVAKGGTPTWFYASQYVGDMPSVAEVLEKARAAAAAAT